MLQPLLVPERRTSPVAGAADMVAMTALEELDTPALRKTRGAFFTPAELCDFVAAWAIREPT